MSIIRIPQRLSKSTRMLTRIVRASWSDIRFNRLGQVWPAKPVTLNLLVNDICNSHCQMCMIWKRKQDKELTPKELAMILRDSLFDRLKYIGVSGGEPTLRKDLPEIFQVLANKRPSISGAGVITNAIQVDKVIESVLASAAVCEKSGVRFNVMVSLDGIGRVHDHIRGRAGNFENALQVIRYLRKNSNIPVIFGCTITKDNVWHVDEILDFAQEENIYGRFRVAEYINRLYNEGQTQYIRNFSIEEKYQLALFFSRLEREYEKSPKYKRTYRNIRSMLHEGTSRTINCPYQSNAVVLDCRGQMLFCSPKSPILGSALSIQPHNLYHQNIAVRKSIIEKNCDQCIHDYHAEATIDELLQVLAKAHWHHKMRPKSGLRSSSRITQNNLSPNKLKHAFIVGWYGSETAGDKAILGQIIYRLKQDGIIHITLASIEPFISRWTVQELGYPEIDVIPTYSDKYLQTAKTADLTIMGGGPLMDLEALGPVLHAFSMAQKNNKQTYIAGCGIGPLKDSTYISIVQKLLNISTRIELRDVASVNWAIKHTGRSDILLTEDPAVGFVERWRASLLSTPSKQPMLNCYLREWTEEYIGELKPDEFYNTKQIFEENLGNWIRQISEKFNLQPRLLPMHYFAIGGDDRKFSRRLARRYLDDLDPIIEIRPLSVQDILNSMLETSYCLTMRFHSTLFAHKLKVPFTAIDYTNGGKVHHYLTDHQASNHMVKISQIIDRNFPPIFLENNEDITH